MILPPPLLVADSIQGVVEGGSKGLGWLRGGGRDILLSGMATERTFAMVKPDGVKRGLVGEILSRIEAKGYRIGGMKCMTIPRETAERHYGEHKGKPFYESLVVFITSGPVVAMVLEGEGAIAGWRTMMGATNPADAVPGSIRGDFATSIDENVVHGSDAPATAEREIGIFFGEGELG